MPPEPGSPESVARLRATRAFLMDMDGTLYVGGGATPGAAAWMAALHNGGARALLLTNNSSSSAAQYQEKLARLGIDAGPLGVLTSGDATCDYLIARTPWRRPFLLGTPALCDTFRKAGLDPDAAEPDCVVVGFDKTLTWDKLVRACRLLWAGAPYYATHPDKTLIVPDGLEPDVRAILAAIREMTGRWPEVIGKPEAPIVDIALARLGATAAQAAIVGDKLEVDMVMARRAGLLGVLVLSGETTRDRLLAAPAEAWPDLVVEHVGALRELWLAP